jgi:HK97 family phage major capsid protein
MEPTTADAFSYLRETERTQNARPVSIGEKKPESVYTLERIDDRIRTIAHLSEPIARNWLMDAPMLRSYVDQNLRAGVILELEDQVLQGTDTGEDLPGILNASGILQQAFDTDILVTARKAISFLETRPVMPTGWFMHPDLWESFELLKDDQGRYYWNGPSSIPINASQRRLWGLPVALTLGMPTDRALVGDWRTAVNLLEREDVRIDWTEAFAISNPGYDEDGATGFQTNQVQFRGEGRWGLEINRPSAVCEVILEQGS